MGAKFLRESLSIERPVQKQRIITDFNNVRSIGPQEPERIIITIEFIGEGDTTKLTTEDLLNKAMNKIGDVL
jgi:hypothetical protein